MTEKEKAFRARVEKRKNEKREKAEKERKQHNIVSWIATVLLIVSALFSVAAIIEATVLISTSSAKYEFIASTLRYKIGYMAFMLLAVGFMLFSVLMKDMPVKLICVLGLSLLLCSSYYVIDYSVFAFDIKNDNYVVYDGTFEFFRGSMRRIGSNLRLDNDKMIDVYGFSLGHGQKYVGQIVYTEHSKCVVEVKVISEP